MELQRDPILHLLREAIPILSSYLPIPSGLTRIRPQALTRSIMSTALCRQRRRPLINTHRLIGNNSYAFVQCSDTWLMSYKDCVCF